MCNAWQSRWEMARRRPSLPWWTRRARRGRIRSRTASSSTFIGRPFWKTLVFWWIYPWSNHFDKSLCFVELTLDLYISRPNTGQQVKQETLGELKKKYKKVIWNLSTCVQWCKLSPSSLERWMEMSARSIGTCSSRAVPRLVATPSGRWNCGTIEDPILNQAANSRYVWSLPSSYVRATARTEWGGWSARLASDGKLTMSSQVGNELVSEENRQLYCSIPGSVLSVWTLVESVLTNDGQKKGQHAKMQVGGVSLTSRSPRVTSLFEGCEDETWGQWRSWGSTEGQEDRGHSHPHHRRRPAGQDAWLWRGGERGDHPLVALQPVQWAWAQSLWGI